MLPDATIYFPEPLIFVLNAVASVMVSEPGLVTVNSEVPLKVIDFTVTPLEEEITGFPAFIITSSVEPGTVGGTFGDNQCAAVCQSFSLPAVPPFHTI